MNSEPLVSVCIPTYNRAAYLREAIASVLAQEGVDFEIIVSDNASSDGTPEIVREFNDTRIRYNRNPENFGPHFNGRKCYEMASGTYIGYLFDDDQMLPGNLARKAKVLDENSTVGMVHSHWIFVDSGGETVAAQSPMLYLEDRISEGKAFFRDLINSNNLVCAPSVVARRECFQKLGTADTSLGFTSDFELWMRLALHYDIAYLAQPLIKYRLHPGQDTNNYVGRLRGIQDLFEGKRLVLDRYRDLVPDYERLRSSIAVRHATDAWKMGCDFLEARRIPEALKCLAYAIRLRPRVSPRMMRSFARSALRSSGTRVVKRLLRMETDDQ